MRLARCGRSDVAAVASCRAVPTSPTIGSLCFQSRKPAWEERVLGGNGCPAILRKCATPRRSGRVRLVGR